MNPSARCELMKVVLSLVLLLAASAAHALAPQTRPRPDARVADLVAKLKGKNSEAADAVAADLVAYGDGAVPALEQLLESEKRPSVVVRAARALGEIKPEHPSVVPALLRVARGRGIFDSEETLMARRAAGMFLAHTPAGIRALPELLKDRDVFARRSAAFALDDPTEVLNSLSTERRAAIGDVLVVFVGALDDKDEVVRGVSCEVLGQIVRSKVEPLSSGAERLLKERGKSRGDCLCECD